MTDPVRTAYQRARRGWARRDAWSADRHLVRVTADLLEYTADNAHGWPSSDTYPTFEDWERALRTNAAMLRRYLDDPVRDELLDRWYAAASTHNTPPEDTERAHNKLTAREDATSEGARTAMHWVADNLESLWI